MNKQQVGEIAQAALESHFGDVKLFRVDVRHGFDYDPDDPMVDVTIIHDGKYEQLNGAGLVDVQTEIVPMVWREAEDFPGFPLVHFLPESELGRRHPATV